MTKNLLPQILALVALCGLGVAQQPSPSQESNSQAQQPSNPPVAAQPPGETSEKVHIAPGSVIPAELTKSIDAKKAKTGDPVEAKVTQDLKAQNGQVVLAKDTRLIGHVTGAQPRTKEQKQSQLGILFDKAEPKDTASIALPMTIQAIVVPTHSGVVDNSASGQNSGQPMPSPNGMPGNTGRPSTVSPSPSQPVDPSADSGSGHDQGGQPPITAETHGVIGNPNLKLSAAANAGDGSVVRSDKSNVKLDSGTLLLLRVNP
jgi:hypothetical protein